MDGPSDLSSSMREQRVEHENDGFVVRRAALDFARQHGFSRVECVEIAIAASELTSNIVKYGVRGSVRMEVVDDPQRGRGVRVIAFDRGPPFRDFEQAVKDGFDDDGPVDPMTLLRRGGLGAGLGAVQRFSDELGWAPEEGGSGKRVWMTRYRKRSRR